MNMNTEQEYSNRELDQKFNGLHEKLDLVIAQTTKTNGSVTGLKAWRTGIVMCLGLIAFIVLPLIIYSFKLSQDNLRQQILLEIKK